MNRGLLLLVFACFLNFLFFSQSVFAQANHVVISEVYGGGGNSGALYRNDFIELYNPTNSAVDLTGWSVQYAATTGSSWTKTNISGTLGPGRYYLIQQAAGSAGTVNLPTPDATGSTAMAAGAGKVVLVSNQITLLTTTGCPLSGITGLIDFVGYGSGTNCFEGTGPTVALSGTPTPSAERKASSSSTSVTMGGSGTDEFLGNGNDGDNNANDFVTRAIPQPQNTQSPAEPVDVTAPVFKLNFPAIGTIAARQFNLVVHLNETGKVYYLVVADGVAAPTAPQVKAGVDNGNAPAISGQISVASAFADFTKAITGLLPVTSYDVYAVAEDDALNLQASPVQLDVTTTVALPLISPSLNTIAFPGFTLKSQQSAQQSYTLTAGDLTNDVSIAVTGAFLISTDNANYSTSLSVNKTVFDGNGAQTVYVKFAPAGAAGTLTGTITHSSTGATDKLVSLSAVSSDPFNQDFNDPAFLTNSGWSQVSKVGVQIWGTTDFGHTCLTNCTGSLDKAAQINGFSGSAQNNEDWLISPQLDLTAFVNYPALSFWTISAFAGPSLQLKYSTDYVGSGDPALANWTPLEGKFPAANSSLWTKSANIILPKSSLYVAVIYTSNTSAASRWTFDDWKVEDVASYVDVPTISFSFGEIIVGNHSPSLSFAFTGVGAGDITVTPSAGFEVSADNSSFAASLVVTQSDALAGKTLYVRFSPDSKKIKWDGVINFNGTGLNSNFGTLSGSSYPKAETFDVTTWNLEFFGTDVRDASNVEFGPTDDALQITNVSTVMQTIGSDIFAVEEIADDAAFDQLVTNLPGYSKIVSNSWSHSLDPPDPNFPPQKVGFIYNNSTIQLVNARPMFAKMYDDILAGTVTLQNYPGGTSSSFWSSGRLPFMATFDVTIGGITKRIRMIDIHAKSGATQSDFDRRKYDAQVLFDSLAAHYANDNIIFLGDFNDDVDNSIYTGSPFSSFKVFVDDATNYNVLTYPLSVAGASSFPSSNSMIDQIIISNELNSMAIANSTALEDPRGYISSYTNTTSDHLPVTTRFQLIKSDQTITFGTLANKAFGNTPFNLTATATSNLTVSYASSNTSVATINGNTVTILAAGSTIITASQAGNSSYNAAADVPQTLTVDKANQTITFGAMADKTLGTAPFSLTATASSSLTVSYSSASDKISISGSQVTLLKSGRTTITAAQAGNTNYNAAAPLDQSFCIKPAKPTITVSNPNSQSPTLISSAPAGNQWYFNGSLLVGATGTTLNVTNAGTYKVQAKTDDCVSDFSTDTPIVITGDLEVGIVKVFVYPNPVVNVLEVTGLSDGKHDSQVIDMTGRTSSLVLEKQNQNHRANVEHLPTGVYLLRVQDEDGIHQVRFIKK